MRCSRWKPIGFATLLSVWNLPAQPSASSTRFDVVSIHLVPPNTPPTMREADSLRSCLEAGTSTRGRACFQ